LGSVISYAEVREFMADKAQLILGNVLNLLLRTRFIGQHKHQLQFARGLHAFKKMRVVWRQIMC